MNTSKIQIIDKGEIYFYEVLEPAETERFDEILKKKVNTKYVKKFRVDPNQLSIFPEATISSLNTNLNTSYSLEQIKEMIHHAENLKSEKEFSAQEANINSGTQSQGPGTTATSKG